jgi:Family of unknown function (DUF6176)
MAESQCLRIKLCEGKTEAFLSWARSLPGRMQEVSESLAAEGILAEHIFLERSASGDYLHFYTRAENLAVASAAFQKSALTVDLEAKKIMAETWDFSSVKVLERVLDF